MTPAPPGPEALHVREMYAADEQAIQAGVPGETLMENAGAAVVDAIRRRWPPSATLVAAGPGANGGDGWVIARLLSDAGWPVRIALLGDRAALTGDTAAHAARWRGPVEAATPDALEGAELVVDALFGAGLNRLLEGDAAAFVAAVDAASAPVVAVDLPSGVNGDTGAVMGVAATAALTVTFFRKKPGHLLAPGRFLCGDVIVAEIGIPAEAAITRPPLYENVPALWPETPRPLDPSGHKYGRGHVLVAGGAETTGAARLAARAALRAGAGLVTIACPRVAWPVYAASETAVMARPMDAPEDFGAILRDPRFSTIVLGPGLGVIPETRALVSAAGAAGRKLVLDADALTAFQDQRDALFKVTRAAPVAVLTPHAGEFRRLFPESGEGRLADARAAAAASGAVIVLKGPDTIIAAPSGKAAINANAPPTLATAGSGDVLAGMIAGLLADGADGFDAAAAAVWLHGAAAMTLGRGLIASDLPEAIPQAFAALLRAP